MKKHLITTSLASSLAITFILLILIFPMESTNGALAGLKLCARVIIPSLFPVCALVLFLFSAGLPEIISKLAYKTGSIKLKKLSDAFIVFIASFIGGYPIGSIMLADSYKQNKISKTEAENLLYSCVNAGPAFIILAVGSGVFGSPKIGRLLFLSSAISSLIIFIFTYSSKDTENTNNNNFKISIYDAFVNSVYKATLSVLSICGYVVLYSSAAFVLKSIPDKYSIIKTVLPYLEVTNGIVLINKNLLKTAFLIGFGGICVHLQVLANSSVFSPSLIKFEVARIVHGALNSIIFYLLLKTFGVTLPTITNGVPFIGKAFYVSLAEGVSLCLLAIALIFSVSNKISGGKSRSFMLKYMR